MPTQILPDKTSFIVFAGVLAGATVGVGPNQYDLTVSGADDPAHLTKGPYTGTTALKVTAPDGTILVINPGDQAYQLTPQAEGANLTFSVTNLKRPDGTPSALVVADTVVQVTAGTSGEDFSSGGFLFAQ